MAVYFRKYTYLQQFLLVAWQSHRNDNTAPSQEIVQHVSISLFFVCYLFD